MRHNLGKLKTERDSKGASSTHLKESHRLFEKPELHKSFRSEHAVVVPVLVRTNGLLTQFERAVRSVHRILKDDEILIVVDDGSPTQFQKAIQASCSWPKIVLLRHCPNVGPASSRNTAMDWCRSNRSEIQTVCFLDADCVVPDANWSAAHRAQQKEVPGIDCGRTISHTRRRGCPCTTTFLVR